MEEVWARSSSRKKMDNEEAMAGLAAFPISDFSYRLNWLPAGAEDGVQPGKLIAENIMLLYV